MEPSINEKNIEVIARAIIADDSRKKILFCVPKDREYFYLPGGHVEFGETAGEALKRELLEETGIQTNIDSYLFAGASEEVFTQKGEKHHEVNLYFIVPDVTPEKHNVSSKEDHIHFVWLSLSELENFPVLPDSVRQMCTRFKNEDGPFWNGETIRIKTESE